MSVTVSRSMLRRTSRSSAVAITSDKRQTAQEMWKTIMDVLESIGAVPKRARLMTDLSRFKTKPRDGARIVRDGKHYQVRRGKLIEYETLNPTKSKKRRPSFEAHWAKFPKYWKTALRWTTRVSTFNLALAILFEAAKLELMGKRGEKITLSSAMTGMPRNCRRRAIKELVKLDLITVEQHGKEAPKALPKHIPKKGG